MDYSLAVVSTLSHLLGRPKKNDIAEPTPDFHIAFVDDVWYPSNTASTYRMRAY